MTDAVDASFLQKQPDTVFILVQPAAGELTLFRRPWELGPVEWTPALIRRAVIGLSLKVGKALLKLSDDDFREHELYELLREHGPAERLGRLVFDQMMATICTRPGRPAGQEMCPQAENESPPPILAFSP